MEVDVLRNIVICLVKMVIYLVKNGDLPSKHGDLSIKNVNNHHFEWVNQI